MARAFALPLAALLVAAAVFRALQPSPPPPVRAVPAVAAPTDVVQEPAPEPAPLPTSAPPPAFVEPVLAADEIRPLLDARFSDETILAFARVSGRPFRPSPEELDALRQAGMSDTLLGRLTGVPVTSEATTPPPVVHVTPVIHVYSPVTVTTVIEAPPPPPEPPYISTVVLVPVGPPPLNAPLPPIYQKPPTFKTYDYMPTKPSPTAEEVARRDHARSTRIYR